MDNFENSPDTTPTSNEQLESTTTTNPPTPTPVSTTTSKPKSKKNLLEIGILIIILAILGGLVAYYLISKNQTISIPQESDTTDQANGETTTQPTLVVVTPTIEPRELKVLADCKMHNINQDGELSVLYEKEELCDYNNLIIDDTQQYIAVWGNSRKLLKVSDGTLNDLPENLSFGYYHPTSNNLYTKSFEETSSVLYKGTLINPKVTKIFEFELTMGGRGPMAEDDGYFAPNNSESYIIYQDTTTNDFFTEPKLVPPSYNGGMVVFTSTGSKLIEAEGAFRTRWIDDSSLVSLVKNENNTQVTIRKYTITPDGKFSFVDLYRINDKSTFGEIYNIDISNKTALLNVYKEEKHLAYIADLSGDTTTLVKYSDIPANSHLMDNENLLGYGLTECDPTKGLEQPEELSCPVADWVFDDYKTDIRIYNIVTKETKTLLKLDEMYLL